MDKYQTYYGCSFVEQHQKPLYTDKPQQLYYREQYHLRQRRRCLVREVQSSHQQRRYVICWVKIAAKPGRRYLEASSSPRPPWEGAHAARVVMQNSELSDGVEPFGWTVWGG
ncbi:hypothetical protein LY76DRAFT_607880 [Colletotrichum caudatum]|nr:hypothetical protein LY76DRAFT_607880 [Colletotrichum caudatum]